MSPRFSHLFEALFLVLTSMASASAMSTRVEFSTLQLSLERGGWRVSLVDHAQAKYGLQEGDLIKKIDDRDAKSLGPLAIAAFLDDGAVRAFPIDVSRSGHLTRVNFYTSTDPVPDAAKLTKPLKVSMGKVAPEFTLMSIDGKPVRLSDYKGSWTLLNFWATWCGPCQEEASILSKLAKAYSPRLNVLAVAVQDEHEKVKAFRDKTKPAYTILESGDLKSAVAFAYGVNNGMGSATVPYSVLIRPDGSIAYVQGGFADPSPLEAQVSYFLSGK